MNESAGAPRRTAVWVVLPIAVAMVLLIVLLASGDPASERAQNSTAIGQVTPLIEGEDLDGQWFSIDDHVGKWVVVNFFSTTCVPCIVEHPELVAFAQRRAVTGDAIVVSVVTGHWQQAIESFGFDTVTVAGEGPVDRTVAGLELGASHAPSPGDVEEALADADVIVVENLCSIPLNLPAARVVAAACEGRPTVMHHHDPPWQRAHFAHITELPIDDPAWRHVTIN